MKVSSDQHNGGSGTLMRRRRRAVLMVAGAAALVAVSGLVGASLVKSPAEVAAETAPPAPSLLTAPVVRQVLSSTIVMRGTFSQGRTNAFTPTSVASTAKNPGGSGLIETGMFARPGERVRAGQVLAEVSDRPIYVLPGPYELWRSLEPGESGRDIAELQAALARLGFSSGGDAAGVFGSGTERAVVAFYQAIGYAPAVSGGSASGSAPGTQAVRSVPAGRQPAAIVPMSEAWFVPRLSAYVASTSSHVGQPVRAPLLTLSFGGLRLTGQLDPSQRALVRHGMAAAISDSLSHYSGRGRVDSLGRLVSPSGGQSYIQVHISRSGAWPASEKGANVQITITASSSRSAVLSVPVAAISSTASGQEMVLVAGPHRAKRRVRVTTGISAGGYVQVTPEPADALAAGNLVVVGLG